jgi:hypothetical protein
MFPRDTPFKHLRIILATLHGGARSEGLPKRSPERRLVSYISLSQDRLNRGSRFFGVVKWDAPVV